MALKEEYSTFKEAGYDTDTMTTSDYAELVITANMLEGSEVMKDAEGNEYFTYTNESNGRTYFYYAVVRKGSDAFWLCQFACLDKNTEKYTPKFTEWAKTIIVE